MRSLEARTGNARRGLLLAVVASLAMDAIDQPLVEVQGPVEELGILYARAETIIRAGDHEGAIVLLDRMIGRFDTSGAAPSEVLRLLLRRALMSRARALWEVGRRGEVDDDLDQVIELAPSYEINAESVSAEFASRFRRRRERRVGFLRIGRFPADLRVFLDGRELGDIPDILPVLAGDHVVVGRRAGYASQREEVSVRNNRTEGVGLSLERSSATLRLATDPPGAVLTLNGEVMGTTLASTINPAATVSLPLIVDALLPGWYEIEVTLTEHRTFRQRLEVPDLSDYDLGVLHLDAALGMLLLRSLPPAANLYVDGELTEPMRQDGVSDQARLELPVGDHRVMVSMPGAGVFEMPFRLEDGTTRSLEVRLLPGIAVLGARGGDELDRDEVLGDLVGELGSASGWFQMDRRHRIADLEFQNDGTLDAAAQHRLEEEIPASVFITVELESTPATEVVLRLWAAGSGLSHGVVRLPRGDRDALMAWVDELNAPLAGDRAWLGALIVDGRPEGNGIVASLTPGGPAASAGLSVGDHILTIDGRPIAGAAEVEEVLMGSPPFNRLAIGYERGNSPGVASVTLGSSPTLLTGVDPARAVALWAAATAALGAGDSVTPRWVLQLQMAHLLLEQGRFGAAVDVLRRVRAPAGAPFGAGAVDYWLGVALLASSADGAQPARQALTRAAADSEARLFHNDGPRLAPRARVRLAELGTQD